MITRITKQTHWLGALVTNPRVNGRRDTPPRALIEAAAKLKRLECLERLFAGLPGVLAEKSKVSFYGPFNYGGQFTSESNAAFDRWLKEKAAHQGIRDFEKVNELAEKAGLKLLEDRAMPSNNRCLIWLRA